MMKKFALLASMLVLVGCQSVAPKLDNQTSALNKHDWNTKSIQIDEMTRDGQWHNLESLSLSKPSSIQGFMARKPDFVLTFEKSHKSTGKITVGVDRKLDVMCADQSNKLSHVFEEDALTNTWEETLKCKNGTWKVILVNTSALSQTVATK